MPCLAALALCPVVAFLEPGDRAGAVARARRVAAWEDTWAPGVTDALQAAADAGPGIATLALAVYHGAHLPALVATGLWLAARRPDHFTTFRATFVTAQLATVTLYLVVPLAPPRLLDEPVFGSSSVLHTLQYEYAAMPSGHVVVATVVAGGLASGTRIGRSAWAYPVLVAAVTITTGNHLLTDVVAGAAVAVIAVHAVRLVDGWRRPGAGRPAP